MNLNKVYTVSNELSNEKEFKPIGDIRLTPDMSISDLVGIVFHLKEDLNKTNQNFATYKETVKEAFTVLQTKFEELSNAIETSKTVTSAELTNIKESIKLLGGVL